MLGNLLDGILLLLFKGLDKSRFFNLTDSIESTQKRINERNAENTTLTIKTEIEGGNSIFSELDAQGNHTLKVKASDRITQRNDYEVGYFGQW